MLLVLCVAASASAPLTQWNKTFGQTGDDIAFSVIQASDGGYVMAGFTYSGTYVGGTSDVWVVKANSSGSQTWNKTFGGSGDNRANSVIQTADGGYTLAGWTNSLGAGGYDMWLIKLDNAGNYEWNKTLGGSGNERASSIVKTPDGGYAVLGVTDYYDGKNDYWLVKTNSTGDMLWNKTFNGGHFDEGYSVIQTPDGGYALGGARSTTDDDHYEFWLIKTDSSGVEEWNATYGGDADDILNTVVNTSDGGYALAGYTKSFGSGDDDFWLIKTNGSGIAQWNKTFGGTGADEGYDVIQASDGGYMLTGATASFGAGNRDLWLIKTDSSGNLQWNKTFGGTNIDQGQGVIQTSEGGYAVTGYSYSYGAGGEDMWLIKTAGLPQPDATHFAGTDTTDFGSVENISDTPVVLHKTNTAKVAWNGNKDASGKNFDSAVGMGADTGGGFVSVDSSALGSAYNSSANITIYNINCGYFLIFHTSQHVTTYSQLSGIGTQVATSGNVNGNGTVVLPGDSTPYATDISCSSGTLKYTALHFQGTGGGDPAPVPEFSTIAMMLALTIVVGAIIYRRNSKD